MPQTTSWNFRLEATPATTRLQARDPVGKVCVGKLMDLISISAAMVGIGASTTETYRKPTQALPLRKVQQTY